jgi:uncharacterized protein (TIGR02246 family)
MRLGRAVAVFVVVVFAAVIGTLPIFSARHSSAARRAAAGDEKSTSATAAIAKIREEWAKDLHTKQLEALAMLYAPDAVFLQPTGERIVGREAIRELCGKVMAAKTSDIPLHSAVTEHSGNLAYDSGEFSETLVSVADGSRSDAHGSYLMVFKRQPDGKWLILEQVWTGIPPKMEAGAVAK